MVLLSTDSDMVEMIANSLDHNVWEDPIFGPKCVGSEGLSGDNPAECAEELLAGEQIAIRWAWPDGTETREEVLLQDFFAAKAYVSDLYHVDRSDLFNYGQLRDLLLIACFGVSLSDEANLRERAMLLGYGEADG
jgi:hypothetical protein